MREVKHHSLAGLVWLAWASSAAAQAPCGTWDDSLLPDASGRGLVSVSASSAQDVWATGRGLYHWDGVSWSSIPAPGLGSPDTVFNAVAVVALNDAWIVGYTAFLGTPQTLVERWNGSTWNLVPSPIVAGGSEFEAIAAVSSNDVWAVGHRAGGLPEFKASRITLTAHWDGSHWTEVPTPNVSNRTHSLIDVEAMATDDVWAVGYYRNIGELFQTLILHWDGGNWSIVPSPNFPGSENILFGVSGTSADDVWAVGEAWDGLTGSQIFLHWDGSSWTQITGPGGTTACSGCTGDVLAMGPNDVWAVGSAIGHWDGTDWSLAPGPDVPGVLGIALRSLTRVGECEAWAVGSSFPTPDADNALAVQLAAEGPPTVSVERSTGQSIELQLSPSPFREGTVIELILPTTQTVRMAIHDVSGREVREVTSGTLAAGRHVFRWDGRDTVGRRAAPGIYFVKATAGNERISIRAVRMN